MAIDYGKALETENVPEIWKEFYNFRSVYSLDEYLKDFKFQPSIKSFLLPNGDVLPVGVNEYHYKVLQRLLKRCNISEEKLYQKDIMRFSLREGDRVLEDLFYGNNVPVGWFTNSQGVLQINSVRLVFPCEYYYGKKLTSEQESAIDLLINAGVITAEEYEAAVKDLESKKQKFETIFLLNKQQQETEKDK